MNQSLCVLFVFFTERKLNIHNIITTEYVQTSKVSLVSNKVSAPTAAYTTSIWIRVTRAIKSTACATCVSDLTWTKIYLKT